MAYSGKMTVANHAALLAAIRGFVTGNPSVPGQDWTVADQADQTYGPSLVFANTGLAGTEKVYVGLYAATHTDSVKGGLVCKVYTRFDVGKTTFLDTQYGNSDGYNSSRSLMPCWNAPVNLWIWSNKARILLIVECNGLYSNGYLGQYKRFCLPSENPFPLACLTDGLTTLWGQTSWHDSLTTSFGTGDIDIDRYSLPFVRTGGIPCGNQTSYATRYQSCHQVCRADGMWTSEFSVIPTGAYFSTSNGYIYTKKPDLLGAKMQVPDSADRPLLPLYLALVQSPGNFTHVLGELYGVRWAPDSRSAAESTVGGWTLFPNVGRVEWSDFMALGDE